MNHYHHRLYYNYINGKYTYLKKDTKKVFEGFKKWESTSVTFKLGSGFLKITFEKRVSVPDTQAEHKSSYKHDPQSHQSGNLTPPFYSQATLGK